LLIRNQQVSISSSIGAAHTATQLIKLRKTIIIGAIYDDCVCTRDVYAVFDDSSCDQHVVLVINEFKHDALHVFLVHLTVTDDEPRLGHQTLDKRGYSLDSFDAVVNEEDLAASRQLQLDS